MKKRVEWQSGDKVWVMSMHVADGYREIEGVSSPDKRGEVLVTLKGTRSLLILPFEFEGECPLCTQSCHCKPPILVNRGPDPEMIQL